MPQVFDAPVRSLPERGLVEVRTERGGPWAFAACYNAAWMIEKHGHRSPTDMRATRQKGTFRRAA